MFSRTYRCYYAICFFQTLIIENFRHCLCWESVDFSEKRVLYFQCSWNLERGLKLEMIYRNNSGFLPQAPSRPWAGSKRMKAVIFKVMALWDVMLGSMVDRHHHFWATFCLHFCDRKPEAKLHGVLPLKTIILIFENLKSHCFFQSNTYLVIYTLSLDPHT
jgi:hypothetical protein